MFKLLGALVSFTFFEFIVVETTVSFPLRWSSFVLEVKGRYSGLLTLCRVQSHAWSFRDLHEQVQRRIKQVT